MNTIATLIILLLFPLWISAHEFEYQFLDSPSKAANVIVTSQTLSRNSTVHLNRLIGRVFNRGEETAHNVVVRYEVLNADGAVVMRGKIPALPKKHTWENLCRLQRQNCRQTTWARGIYLCRGRLGEMNAIIGSNPPYSYTIPSFSQCWLSF